MGVLVVLLVGGVVLAGYKMLIEKKGISQVIGEAGYTYKPGDAQLDKKFFGDDYLTNEEVKNLYNPGQELKEVKNVKKVESPQEHSVNIKKYLEANMFVGANLVPRNMLEKEYAEHEEAVTDKWQIFIQVPEEYKGTHRPILLYLKIRETADDNFVDFGYTVVPLDEGMDPEEHSWIAYDITTPKEAKYGMEVGFKRP